MNLWDIQPEKKWQEVLDQVSEEFQIYTKLSDAGGRILLESGKNNALCSEIRSNPDSLTFVCSQTGRRIFHFAEKNGEPLSDFCEIGLYHTVVPIFADGVFLGGLSACGIAISDEPLDEFLVAKSLDIEEEQAAGLIRQVPLDDRSKADRIVERFVQLIGKKHTKRDPAE